MSSVPLNVDTEAAHIAVNESSTVLSLHSEPSSLSVSVDSVSAGSDSVRVWSEGNEVVAECQHATSGEVGISVEGSVGTAEFDREKSVSVSCDENTE